VRGENESAHAFSNDSQKEKHDNLKLYLKLEELRDDIQRHDFSAFEEISRGNLLFMITALKKSISNLLLSEIRVSSLDLLNKMMSLSKDGDYNKSKIISLFLEYLPRHLSASRLMEIDDKDFSSSCEIFSRVLASILLEEKKLDDFLEYATEAISRIEDNRSQISYCKLLWRDIQPLAVLATSLKRDFLELGLCLQGIIWTPSIHRRIAIVNGVDLIEGQSIPLLQFGLKRDDSIALTLYNVRRLFVIIKYKGYLCRLRMKEGKRD
jgi:hypothetical protein